MSWEATSWARNVRDIDPTSKLILILLADHVSVSNTVFPAIGTLADDACVSRATIKRRLSQLSEKKLISVVERTREDGGRSSNGYTVNIGTHIATPPVQSEPAPPVHSYDPPPGSLLNQPPGSLLNHANGTPIVNHQSNPQLSTPDFSDFWKLYPRKKGKKVAAKAWAKAVKETPAQEIIDGLTRLLPSIATQYRGKGEDYRHNPSTWLNGGYWEDETEVPMSGGDMAMGALYETLRRDADNECEQSGNRAIGDRKSENGLLTGPQS